MQAKKLVILSDLLKIVPEFFCGITSAVKNLKISDLHPAKLCFAKENLTPALIEHNFIIAEEQNIYIQHMFFKAMGR